MSARKSVTTYERDATTWRLCHWIIISHHYSHLCGIMLHACG